MMIIVLKIHCSMCNMCCAVPVQSEVSSFCVAKLHRNPMLIICLVCSKAIPIIGKTLFFNYSRCVMTRVLNISCVIISLELSAQCENYRYFHINLWQTQQTNTVDSLCKSDLTCNAQLAAITCRHFTA